MQQNQRLVPEKIQNAYSQNFDEENYHGRRHQCAQFTAQSKASSSKKQKWFQQKQMQQKNHGSSLAAVSTIPTVVAHP